ncbi:MAG: PsiF family protein, partial [Pseudomonadota bacterium]
MKNLMSIVLLGTAVVFGNVAFAASHAGAPMAGASAKKADAPKAAPATAATPATPATPAAPAAPVANKQQTKMGDCNADAKEKALKGDERKKFMSSCLKGKSDAQKAQQAKMGTCNKDAGAKKLKGD